MADEIRYKCGGFLFISKRGWYSDPGDYLDWIGKVWTFRDLAKDLKSGVLPLGLIINVENYPPMIVTAENNCTVWKLTSIVEFYDTLAFANVPKSTNKKVELTISLGGKNVVSS